VLREHDKKFAWIGSQLAREFGYVHDYYGYGVFC